MPDASEQLRPTDIQVLEAIAAWRQTFEAARLPMWGIRQRKLDPGERLAVKIVSVGAVERDLRGRPDEWGPRPGSTGLSGKPLGAPFVTSRRLFIVGNGKNTVREWYWSDLYAVSVIPGWTGVAMRPSADAVTGDVVAREWSRGVIFSEPNRRKLAIDWLKAEGTFGASRGEMDAWCERLPSRLAAAAAQDA